VSCAHTSAGSRPGRPGRSRTSFSTWSTSRSIPLIQHGTVSEEGWLDEGLSLYAEELTARRSSSGDTATFSRLAINAVSDAYSTSAPPARPPID